MDLERHAVAWVQHRRNRTHRSNRSTRSGWGDGVYRSSRSRFQRNWPYRLHWSRWAYRLDRFNGFYWSTGTHGRDRVYGASGGRL